jgi:bifunctional DNA-binding transcriptional regulator/antitoxin component of YhaV-PrlF toxin-antitoxin module
MIHAIKYGNIFAMKDTIQMDASGRLVLPRLLRERLNLRGGARLRADVVAGHIELVPVAADDAGVVLRKGGIAVLKRTGVAADSAAAVAAERAAQEGRGLRR